jgi:hypothetical protein
MFKKSTREIRIIKDVKLRREIQKWKGGKETITMQNKSTKT